MYICFYGLYDHVQHLVFIIPLPLTSLDSTRLNDDDDDGITRALLCELMLGSGRTKNCFRKMMRERVFHSAHNYRVHYGTSFSLSHSLNGHARLHHIYSSLLAHENGFSGKNFLCCSLLLLLLLLLVATTTSSMMCAEFCQSFFFIVIFKAK